MKSILEELEDLDVDSWDESDYGDEDDALDESSELPPQLTEAVQLMAHASQAIEAASKQLQEALSQFSHILAESLEGFEVIDEDIAGDDEGDGA